MHIMAGRTSRYNKDEMEITYLDNLRFAADRLQKVSVKEEHCRLQKVCMKVESCKL